jgi:ABC-type nitrate/sulfonate/bicarbonate transport system permease component
MGRWVRRLGHLAWQKWEIVLVPVGMVAFVGLWALVRQLGDYPTFILPTPREVWSKLLVVVADGTLWYHSVITLTEILGGLALGLTAATLLGYLLAK